MSYKCEHFQQNIPKYTHFLHKKYTKWSILKFKFHNSKISLAPLRRCLVIQTEILVSVAWLRNLKSFQAAMKRLRHVDVTMTWTSNGVVIRGLPNGGLSFLPRIKLASTEFSPDYCKRNNSLSISNSIWENNPASLSATRAHRAFWNLVDTV